ncbi:MAG: hypothetical protein IJU69_05160, partial [Bacteroidales bacterium]|nr:hypothetical protein [Bacteroidales bacterium]
YTVSSNGQVVGGIAGEVAGGATIQGTSSGSRASNTLTVSAESYVGGITGNVYNGTVQYYNNSGGTVTGSGSYVSGIAGCIGKGAASTVTECTNSRAVTGSGSNVGGVAGHVNNGTVSSSTNSGTVTGATRIGGIAGAMTTATVSSCTNSGTVATSNTAETTEIYLGGCVGIATGTGTVNSCSNTKNISTSGRMVGGIVGRVTGATDITSCTHTNNVVSTGYYVGGIVGDVYVEAGGAGIRSCYANEITVKTTSAVAGLCGGIAGRYYSPTNASGDVTNVIYRCQARGCTIQATTTKTGDTWETCRIGGIAGQINNSSRIIQCASKANTIYGRNCCGGIVGMIQTKGDLSKTSHVLVRGCISRSNWLRATFTDADNELGGIAGYIYQDASSNYVRITECISNANCYQSPYSEDAANWKVTCGGIAGKISGDGADVAIRNSFSDHHQTVAESPRTAGYHCFRMTSRTKAAGKAGAGGFVGYFASGDTGILRIYNSGSHLTYGAWYMKGEVDKTEYLNYDSWTNTKGYDWRTLGINPLIGRVYRGRVVLNVVFWSTLAAPFTYNQWHTSNQLKDLRSDDSTSSFDYSGEYEYLTSNCINSDFTVKVVYHFADQTTQINNYTHTHYWKPFSDDNHKPTRVKWGADNWQACNMLSTNKGYARDDSLVNEGMGYEGHNWVRTNGHLINNDRWHPGGVWYGN